MPAHLFIFIRCFHSFSQSCSPRALMASLNCEHNFCWESRGAAVGSKKRKESRDHMWCQQMWINEEWHTEARGSSSNSDRWSACLRFQTIIWCHAVVGALYRAQMTNMTILACVWWKRHLCRNTHHFYLNGPLMVCIYAELKLPLLTAGYWRENGLKLSCCSHGYWCWAT